MRNKSFRLFYHLGIGMLFSQGTFHEQNTYNGDFSNVPQCAKQKVISTLERNSFDDPKWLRRHILF